MNILKTYNEKFGNITFNSINTSENLTEDFERVDKFLKDDEKWKNLKEVEFYDYGVNNFYDYTNDAGKDQAKWIINKGKEFLGESTNEEFLWDASDERVGTWKEMNKEERIAFLINNFSMDQREAEEIYSEKIKELPDEIKNYFYDKD